MSNTRAPFKQIDVTRAVKGAVAAGLAVGGFKIDPRTGEIFVFASGAVGIEHNPWDEAAK